ncbi:hypothetical protein A5672_12935 [Mycobacterium alsense]|uniref:PE domain-containing protein n=1 Tax=Mycobacterium alsense TaxID=324058 RepID=A0ABD6P5C8_9MYCO|nr:PE family protein [Mycobacterium alsense]OBG41094.1 hypothetical protein A5672_12935 [Mycobacterium alsense]
MSFVTAMPDLVENAAENLAGIRSSLAEAAAIAAGPTTGVATAAQDEVSIAIASMFGNAGREFQVLSAQAQAFHTQFVASISGGAAAYASAEAANASIAGGESLAGQIASGAGQSVSGALGVLRGDLTALSGAITGAPLSLSGAIQAGAQGVSRAVTGFETQLAALATGGTPGLVSGFNAFANQVAGPYQTLVSNTVTNLQLIGDTTMANPLPFLHQLANNQIGYGQAIATTIGTGLQNLPAELANLPVTVQGAVQAASSFNAVPYLQEFVTQQVGYVQTVNTSLANAAYDFGTELIALPGALGTAFQQLLAGNTAAATGIAKQAFTNLFLTGLSADFDTTTGLVTITPTGTLGALSPMLALPGQMAQNFTNFMPPSIARDIAQNVTNLITTATNTSSTANLAVSDAIPLTLGLPLALGIDLIGSPVTTLNAMAASATSFVNAVQTGSVSGAIASVLTAPAVVADGFLNGHATLALPYVQIQPFLGSLTTVPLGGILTPLGYGQVTGVLDGLGELPFPTVGTTFGGIVPGLLNYLPQALAEAIGAPPVDTF